MTTPEEMDAQRSEPGDWRELKGLSPEAYADFKAFAEAARETWLDSVDPNWDYDDHADTFDEDEDRASDMRYEAHVAEQERKHQDALDHEEMVRNADETNPHFLDTPSQCQHGGYCLTNMERCPFCKEPVVQITYPQPFICFVKVNGGIEACIRQIMAEMGLVDDDTPKSDNLGR